MKIAIATTYHPSLASLAELTDENKREYAYYNKYDYRRLNIQPTTMNFAWSRWMQFLDLFKEGYDWILCCGVDVLFTNFYVPITSLIDTRRHIVVSRDALMIAGDVMLLRNSMQAGEFITDVLQLESKYRHDMFQDQAAMEEVIRKKPGLVTILPQCDLQPYEYAKYAYLGGNYAKAIDQQGNRGQWQPGDFILHCPGRPLEEKVAEIIAHLPLVIRPDKIPTLSNSP